MSNQIFEAQSTRSREFGSPPRNASPSRFRIVPVTRMWMGTNTWPQQRTIYMPRMWHQMCSRYQVPWYQGITCRQYDGYDRPELLYKRKKTSALRYLLRKFLGMPRLKGPQVFVHHSKALELERTTALMKAASKQKDQALKSRIKIGIMCKKCPGKGCGAPIERASGCSRMKCGRCGCDFCFTCLRLWQFSHYDSCNDVGHSGYEARTAVEAIQQFTVRW